MTSPGDSSHWATTGSMLYSKGFKAWFDFVGQEVSSGSIRVYAAAVSCSLEVFD